MAETNCSSPELLEARSIGWRVNAHAILDNLSFSVAQGEFVGVIGPNGAGKSSLLRSLYRQINITSGEIFLKGRPIQNYSRRALAQCIAVVLQEPPTQFELSVFDVIGMGLIPQKSLLAFDTETDRNAIVEAAEQVDIKDKLSHPFNWLSGGEKQRVMIARAILQKPQLLLMDEPTNHLDVQHQIEVLQLARKMGIAVMVSIHDLNLAASYCDRLLLLDEGQLVAQGSPEKVLTQKTLRQVFAVNALVDTHPFSGKKRITFDLDGLSHA